MDSFEWMLEIVNRAVLDWRLLIQAKAWRYNRLFPAQGGCEKIPCYNCNFAELRDFFKSEWCQLCLQLNHSSVSAPTILEKLEAELAEAKAKYEGKEPRAEVKREKKRKKKRPENVIRKQCKGCAYFKTGHGDRCAIRFCHHYLDTGIRRKVGEEGECLSKTEKGKKLCKPFDAPIAQV